MSRIGNKIIELPAKVKLNVSGDGAVSVEGPKGKLAWTLPKQIKAKVEDGKLAVSRRERRPQGARPARSLPRLDQ